jgi:hypothetical protein
VLLFPIYCFSQQYDDIYGSTIKKVKKNDIVIDDPILGYDIVYQNGTQVKFYQNDSILIYAILITDDKTEGVGKHFTVRFGITNHTQKPFNFSEKNISGFYQFKGNKDTLVRYDYLTVEKKLKRLKMWADIFTGLGEAATSYNESMAYNSSSNINVKDAYSNTIANATVTTKDYDKMAQNKQERLSAYDIKDAEERSFIENTVNEYVKINTIFPDKDYSSYIFFKKPKAEKVWFTFSILNNKYSFDWDINK